LDDGDLDDEASGALSKEEATALRNGCTGLKALFATKSSCAIPTAEASAAALAKLKLGLAAMRDLVAQKNALHRLYDNPDGDDTYAALAKAVFRHLDERHPPGSDVRVMDMAAGEGAWRPSL
jgi:hypothetical protein